MPKVLLVEDDNNLREIFEMRLQAEGYKTVTASDGEEALVVAVKEKPELVIADVMMPKLSGFEMVENMRASPELANAKVIMMTALGQAEDRARGDKLGVVKYLVKSQVTLEDFVRVVREVLPPDQAATAAKTPAPTDTSGQTVQPDAATTPSVNNTNSQESEQAMQDDSTTPTNPPADSSMPPAGDAAGADSGASANPMNAGENVTSSDPQTTAQEANAVNSQIDDFANDPNAGTSDAGVPAGAPPADSSMPPAGDATAVDNPMSTPAVDPVTGAPAGDAAGPAAPGTASEPASPDVPPVSPPAEGEGSEGQTPPPASAV